MSIVLTRDQVRQIDRLSVDRYGLTGLVLMENAGLNATRIIRRVYGPMGSAFIACGTGNNGGDGCVIARHLHNAEWHVRVLMAGDPERMTPDTAANFQIIRAMGVAITVAPNHTAQLACISKLEQTDVFIDALLGTGFRGEVRSPTADLIRALPAVPKRATVAVDVPSGLDCDTGEPANATIKADLTITFVATKTGFLRAGADRYTGQVEVADIGAPRALLAEVAGLD
jgi:NAD(P)H-hydrate epimerase